jgi:hypothetical protein
MVEKRWRASYMNKHINKLLKEWKRAGLQIKPSDIINFVKDTIHFKEPEVAEKVLTYYTDLWNDELTSIGDKDNLVHINLIESNMKMAINDNNELIIVPTKNRVIIELPNNMDSLSRQRSLNTEDDGFLPMVFTKHEVILGNNIKIVAYPTYE